MIEESQSVVVSYLEGGASLEVRRIAAWNRGDIDAPVMSASSGPKDYFKNEIYALFQKIPGLQRIVMVRAGGPPFLLFKGANGWVDVSGKPVRIGNEALSRNRPETGADPSTVPEAR